MDSSLIAPDLRTTRPCLIELRFSKFNQVREFYIETSNDELKSYLSDLLTSVMQTKASLIDVLLKYLENDSRFNLELFDLFKEVLFFFNPNQGMIIDTEKTLCRCFGISYNEVRDLIANGAKDLLTITNLSKAGGGCGSCVADIRPMLESTSSERKIPEVTFLSLKKESVANKRPIEFLKEDLFPFISDYSDIEIEGLVGKHLYVIGDEDGPSASKLRGFLKEQDEEVSLFFI